jgi:hypothetical protein
MVRGKSQTPAPNEWAIGWFRCYYFLLIAKHMLHHWVAERAAGTGKAGSEVDDDFRWYFSTCLLFSFPFPRYFIIIGYNSSSYTQ